MSLRTLYKTCHRPVIVNIYEYDIPPFVEKELERLYENVYCTLTRFNIYGAANSVSTYVTRCDDEVTAVFLFSEERGEIKVINQQIAIDAAHILKFSETIFARYSSAKTISFYAIDTNIARLPYPFQKFKSLEEHVLTLPATSERYLASLSAKMRRNLRKAEKDLKKQFPSFRYEIWPGSDVSEQTVREIILLTGKRMNTKRKNPYLRENDTDHIIRLIRAYGSVGVATIDGRISGGIIWYGVGTRNFMHIIAHDPAYDKYMLGNQLMFFAFCECISRGGRECWMMGGGSVNKARFLAFPTYLDSIVIFRSRVQVLLSFCSVSATAFSLLPQLTKDKVGRFAQGETFAARLAAKVVALARSILGFRP